MDREQCRASFAPRNGSPGKDVIWLPTLGPVVTAMLEAAKVTSKDYVIDLGAGDGKIPIAAAKRYGARALGIEYNSQLVQLAQCYVRAEGLTDRVRIQQGDIFATDFSAATVLTLYLLTDLNLKLRPTILRMKPGTRVVSNTFQMGEWAPDEFIQPAMGNTHAYLWIVPAQVAGTWTFREGSGADTFQVVIRQRFQEVSAAALPRSGVSIIGAKLSGADIELRVGGANRAPLDLKGRVAGNTMELSGQREAVRVRYLGQRE
jgi:hypothetical protein